MTHTQHSARMTLLHKSVFRHPSPAVCAKLTQSQALGCCMHLRWPWQVHGTHHTYCFPHLHRKRTHPFRIRSAGVSHSQFWTTSSIYCSHFPRHSCEIRSRGFLREDKLLQYHTVRHAGGKIINTTEGVVLPQEKGNLILCDVINLDFL